MAQERVNIFTDDGIVTLSTDVPPPYTDALIRPAFSAGFDSGIRALWDLINPEAPMTPAGAHAEPDARDRDALVTSIAESILWQNQSDENPGVDWPSDIYDAKRIVEAVLDKLGQ